MNEKIYNWLKTTLEQAGSDGVSWTTLLISAQSKGWDASSLKKTVGQLRSKIGEPRTPLWRIHVDTENITDESILFFEVKQD